MLVVAQGIAGAANTKNEQVAQMTPAVRIPVGPLGFIAPSPAYLSFRYALTTVDFIDNDHLLFTYHAHTLMQRIPNDDGRDNDQVIHAEVLDIASGKVTQQADWRMHDRERYLWALNDGQFLVRQRNSLFITDSKLELRPYLMFDSRLRAVELSPDRTVMLLEIEKIVQPEAGEASPEGSSSVSQAGGRSANGTGAAPSLLGTGHGDTTGATVTPQRRTELVLLHPIDKTVIGRSEAKHVVDFPLYNDGFVELLQGKDANQWVLRKAFFKGEPKEFGMVRSTCMPDLMALSETVVLAVHCSANRTAGDKVVTAISTDKGTLWKDEWQDKYIWQNFGYATDGSRFAYESLEVNRPMGSFDQPEEEDVKGQPVGVFDTESGKLELVEDATPVLTGGSNFALSADGRRFAILRAGAIEVYDLPPVPAVTEKDKK